MAMGISILGIHSTRQCLDSLQVQLVQITYVCLGLFELVDIKRVQLVKTNRKRNRQNEYYEARTFIKQGDETCSGCRSQEIEKVQSNPLTPNREKGPL